MSIVEEEQSLISGNRGYSDPFRYYTLLLFAIPNISNAMLWITTSPIASQIENAYDVESWEVSLCSSVFMIVYIFINFPANYVLDKYGMKPGILIGGILTAVGAGIRLLIDQNFVFVIIGQTLGAIGQPFLLNAPAKIANDWFIPDQRALATSIASVINPVGVGIGFILPGVFVSSDSVNLKDQIYRLLLVEAIIIGFTNLFTVIFIRNKPKFPPSFAASTKKTHFKEAVIKVFKNRNYILILLTFSLVLGVFNALATLVERVIEPFGYSNTDASIIGALLIVFGVFGAAVMGYIVEKTFWFKKLIIICCLIGVILMTLFFVGLWFEWNFTIISIIMALLGFFLIPVMPLSFELACELSFPIGEAIAAGMLVTGGQLSGTVLVFVFSFTPEYDKANSYLIVITCCACLAFGTILMVPLKQVLNRTNNEKEQIKTQNN